MTLIFVNIKDPEDAHKLAKQSKVRSHIARYQWRNPANRQAIRRRKKTQPPLPCDSTANHGKGESSSQELIPSLLGGGLRVDPFRTYPVTWYPFVPSLVDHYLVSMAVDIPELDTPGNRGLLRTSWFPLAMAEPALFLVIILLAASNRASMRSSPLNTDSHADQAMRGRLLGLRCSAMRGVRQTIASQSRHGNLSDGIIGAIAKMASYEAMFGTLENYHLHMQALVVAVERRGGLESLGLNGLLRRIVVWIDRNAAFIHGLELYFPGATFIPGQTLPEINPGHFLADS